MKHPALLLVLASISLGGCAMSPADGEGSSEDTSSATEPLIYIANPFPTIVDFDRDPAQAIIADGATVDATYNSWGVNFTCISCASGHAFARGPGRTGNGVSLVASPTNPLFDARFGAVRAEFTTPRSWVSIDVLAVLPVEYKGTPVARPWLEAYDSAGIEIGSAAYYPSYGSAGFGQWQTLRIDAPNGNIKAIRLSSQAGAPAVYGVFDNLTFNTDPYWIDVTHPRTPNITKSIGLHPTP